METVKQLTEADLDGQRWYEFANCLGLHIDLFYPSKVTKDALFTDYRKARQVCGNCIVKDLCLMAALKEEIADGDGRLYGMRGGKTPQERARLISIITGRNLTQWRNR